MPGIGGFPAARPAPSQGYWEGRTAGMHARRRPGAEITHSSPGFPCIWARRLALVTVQPFRIAHISDLHCGGPYFEPSLLDRAIAEVNDLRPDVVVCTGDLTTFGFKHEYQLAREYVDRLDCDALVVVPGNHDSRNVGYIHFEELFGERNSVLRKGGVAIVAVDSTEPDLDHGQIGRGRYTWIEEEFGAEPSDL